jgi:hypothetical protein
MVTPDELERQHTFMTAAVRYDELRMRESLAEEGLGHGEALELLALQETLIRKAAYGRQLAIRSARAAGASWSQIGAATGMSKQAAWESHLRWIADQSDEHRRTGFEGMSEVDSQAARELAGDPDRDH